MAFRQLFAPLSVAILLATSCDSRERTAVGSEGAELLSAPATQGALDASRTVRDWPLNTATLFNDLIELARDLAHTEYTPPRSRLPRALTSLTYEEYRAIEFRSDAAIWQDRSLFEVQLFHPGFLYPDPVRIHLVHEEQITELAFDETLFEYGDAAAHIVGTAARLATSASAGPGYAGFRIHYPLNSDTSKDEVVVFLGASYFRLLGRGHAHGLSSRGLAVDIAEEGGEEFPAFRAFWLLQPEPDASTLSFFGLLEGPSVVGAYRFDLEPGDPTTLAVDARLFARRDIGKLGVAPLTSMFLYGPNKAPLFDDYRPQVHDSDGLLMRTSGEEWIWRPLSNREGVQVTSLRDSEPRGFGLVQRDRSFQSYLDLEAEYHRRPSEWVAFEEGDWGIGGVELVELPTPSEFNDNIVAYWAPDEPFRAGDERAYRYHLVTFDDRLDDQTLGQVERTRIGLDALPGQGAVVPQSQRRFIVDFRGGELGALEAADTITAFLVTSSGQVSDPIVQRLPGGLGHRATFSLRPADRQPADMSLFLEVPGRRVSETWSYLWISERDE